MIDIHNHILPAIDDGAEDLSISIKMARQAVADGITTIVATPHHGNGRFINEAQFVADAVKRFNEELLKEKIPLEVLVGQEVHTYHNWLDDITGGNLTGINGSKYLLIEFSNTLMLDSRFESNMEEIMHELQLAGLTPIIAHPERYRIFANDPSLLTRCIDQGALAQVTAHALTGLFGRKIQETAMKMLRSGYIHVIASDAHDDRHRPLQLANAYALIEKNLGARLCETLKNNAAQIVNNKDVQIVVAKTRKRNWFFF
jgi:protein-tyrosine phosphatase